MQNTNEDQEKEKSEKKIELGDDKDWFLQIIASTAATSAHYKIPLTLSVGGNIISGIMISFEIYLKKMSKTLSDFSSSITKKTTDLEKFIHLDEAKIISGGQLINVESPLRVRINSVDAFFLGRLT